jgi:ornithine carbamoyltransferase
VNAKHLLTLSDWPSDDIAAVLELAHEMKSKLRRDRLQPSLAGKTLALVFEKRSMRTRVSFEVAMTQLGGASLFLSKDDINLGEREPVKDGSRVLSRYVDGVAARVYEHAMVEELARYSSIPIINALSDEAHPCQALADLMTIQERFEDTGEITVAYIGDANNVARSLSVICAKLGVDFRIAAPKGYRFDEGFERQVRSFADASGSRLEVAENPREAATGAHVLYTDTWVSMGQEEEARQRMRAFEGYCVDDTLSANAADDHIVLHCLPAHRGHEITDAVMEGPHSAVFDEAENRLHAQRALLHLLMSD